MDIISFQDKLKSQSLVKDSLTTLARDLGSKLITTESPAVKTLDAELVLHQAIWFVFHQQLAFNHEYPAHQYTDLSKPAPHELTKPFSYNTEENYFELLSYYKSNPAIFAKVLFVWDSQQSLSQLNFPPGLTRETLTYTMAYTILHDLFGESQSFGTLNIATTSANQTREPLLKVTTFLLSYIDILSDAYQKQKTSINMDIVTWMLRPNTIFPKLLTIFLQSTSQTAFTNAVLPVISWFQSNEHLDLSADWMTLIVGFQQSLFQKQSTNNTTASSTTTTTDDDNTPTQSDIPPPQIPQNSTLSPSYMNVFSTFCYLSNLTLAQPGALVQLSINFLSKLLESFTTLIHPEVIAVFNKLGQCCGDDDLTSTLELLSSLELTQHHPIQRVDLDDVLNLVLQCKQITPPAPSNRSQLQSLFSPQLRETFVPILSVSELSTQLPSILVPCFDLKDNSNTNTSTNNQNGTTQSSDYIAMVDAIFKYSSAGTNQPTTAATPPPQQSTSTTHTSNLLLILFHTIVKPVLHTPEIFSIITTTPITAISRRNLLIMTHYIQLLLQTVAITISTPNAALDVRNKLFIPLVNSATTSLEQFISLVNHTNSNNLSQSTSTPLLQSSSTLAATNLQPSPSAMSNSLTQQPYTSSQASFMRSVHVPSIALAHFMLCYTQVLPQLVNWCKTILSFTPLTHLTHHQSRSDLVLCATPLNSLYTMHSMTLFAISQNHISDSTLTRLTQSLPQPPALVSATQHGNRYLLLRITTPAITNLQQQFDNAQVQTTDKFWALSNLDPIISSFFNSTQLSYSDDDKALVDIKNNVDALKHAVSAITTCLSALPPLSLFPIKDDVISTLLSLSTYFGYSQHTPQGLIILESMSSLVHALPAPFALHNFALVVHILQEYQQITSNNDDLTSSTLSLQLVAAINQHVPALVSRLRNRYSAVVDTLFKYQVRKHIATHYATILSFHTFLSKEIPQNFNLYNGYQRTYHRYTFSLLPAPYEFYFKNVITKNRSAQFPTLPLPLPTNQSTSITNYLPINTPRGSKSFSYFTSLMKMIPPSSPTNLSQLSLFEIHKSLFSSFTTLPLNGVTAILHPSCGGRHPVDASRDLYVCTDCYLRFQHKQKILRSFLSKYFCDRIIVNPTTAPAAQSANSNPLNNQKRMIELPEIAGYGGGMLVSGLAGILPQFNLDPSAQSTLPSSMITPMVSYTSVIDYVISHTTLKMFSICPMADCRFSLDLSFLRASFPTFSSFYSYMSQPQNDAIDRAIVLPFVLQHLFATLQAYQHEKSQQAINSPFNMATSPSPAAQTVIAPPSMEDDPLAALVHQELNPPSVPPTPLHSAPLSPTELNQNLQTKINESIDHIYLQLISLLPRLNDDANTTAPNNDAAFVTRLQIVPNVPYVGHSTIVESILQLERALTVSSIQSKLYAFESLRSVLTTSLANPVISALPYALPSSIDGTYYQEYNQVVKSEGEINDGDENTSLQSSTHCWTKIDDVVKPALPLYSHSLCQRNLSPEYQPPYQFANLYDFGYTCHEKSPHHHSLAVYQHNQSSPQIQNSQQNIPAQVNSSRFFDKHTKLPHVIPFYPSLHDYLNYFPLTQNFPTITNSITSLNERFLPYHPSNLLPFYPFIEQSNTDVYIPRIKSSNSADDFISLLCYTLIIAQPRHLPSTLSYIKVIYFGLTQAGFSHSSESEYKSFMDICIAFRAIQNVSDRLRHNAKVLFEKIAPPELLTFSRSHLTPKPYNNVSVPTSHQMNKIEAQRHSIIQAMVQEGYNPDDVSKAVESMNPQALFDDSYKTVIPNKIRSIHPTY